MSLPDYLLSKTAFLKLEQCDKAFFLYKKFPYLKDKADPEKLQRFKRGHEVGTLAHQLFPGGVDVSAQSNNLQEALLLTKKLVEEKCPVIYEATFMYKGLLVMVDILHLENEVYRAYEVKSSLKISEVYIRDACLQYYVLKHALNRLEDFFLVTINGDYVLDGAFDLRKYFKKRSILEKAEANLSYFETRIQEAALLIEKDNVPEREIGPQCFRPYTCDFFGHCWKGKLEDYSLFNFPFTDKLKLFEWFNAGFRKLEELGDTQLEKPWQRIIRNCIVHQETYLEKTELQNFLGGIQGKIVALDMEIWNPAIPELQGSKAFEQIPFLISLSWENGSKDLFYAHEEDERENIAADLIKACAEFELILVYDKTLELSVLADLSRRFPDYAEGLAGIRNKMLDLFEPFAKHWFYHPGFKNNLSLKSVTAVLVPEFSYGDIRSGVEALMAFDNFRLEPNPIQKEILKDQLITYCQNDCKAVLKLLAYLMNIC